MFYDDSPKWSEYLPLVPLGIRSQTSSMGLPSPSWQVLRPQPLDNLQLTATDYIGRLRDHFSRVRPSAPRVPSTHRTTVSPHLRSASEVFLRTDALRGSLQPPYSGPHHAIERHPKYFVIDHGGRRETASIDRLKAASTESDTQPPFLTASSSNPTCQLHLPLKPPSR
ncbi:uncharacterized protein LOC135372612 [Ornithodoros turicata]|uniref:uncharacterized protein LOC135372612 n=1 Tax=Ornithodoros turicata TaxID=34597 RepID=UPI003138F5F9